MGMKVRREPGLSQHSGGTLLHDAILAKDHKDAAWMLQNGFDPNAREKRGYGWYGRSPAHIAVECGDLQGLKLLEKHGADLGIQASHGTTLLHTAAEEGHTAIVEYLLSKGAVSQPDSHYGITALHHAARIGHARIVKKLLAHGADADVESKRKWFDTNIDTLATRMTALQVAEAGKHEAAAELLRKVTQESSASPQANQLLQAAVKKNSLKHVTLALSAGAACDQPLNEDGETSLHHAARYCKAAIVQALLASVPKPNVNTKDCWGFSVLHAAALAHDNLGLVNLQLLLDAGAKAHTATSYGSTPLSIRATRNDRKGAQLLLDHGAKVSKKTGRFASKAMREFLDSKR